MTMEIKVFPKFNDFSLSNIFGLGMGQWESKRTSACAELIKIRVGKGENTCTRTHTHQLYTRFCRMRQLLKFFETKLVAVWKEFP